VTEKDRQFLKGKIGVTLPVAALGNTDPSDATAYGQHSDIAIT